MITKYFKKVETWLEKYRHIVEDFMLNQQTFTPEKGAIDGKVFFNDDSRMDFLEVLDTNKTEKEKYSYHYMNKDNEMIFRYDNAKHYPNLKTFPHHKHTTSGTIESNEPTLSQVLNEIEQYIASRDPQ